MSNALGPGVLISVSEVAAGLTLTALGLSGDARDVLIAPSPADLEAAVLRQPTWVVVDTRQLPVDNLGRYIATWPQGTRVVIIGDSSSGGLDPDLFDLHPDAVVVPDRSVDLPARVIAAIAGATEPATRTSPSVSEGFPIPVFHLSPTGRVVHVNNATVRLLGYPDAATLLATPFRTLFPTEPDLSRLISTMETKDAGAVELRVNHRSGRTLWVELHGAAVTNDAGNLDHYEAAVVDITSRKEAFDSVSQLEGRLSSFFERSPVAHWVEDFSSLSEWLDRLRSAGVTDLRTHLDEHPEAVAFGADLIRIVEVNQAALDLIGADSLTDLSGHGLRSVVSDRSIAAFKEQMLAAWDGKTSFRTYGAGETLDGEPIEYILTWVVAERSANNLSRVIVSIEDMTQLNAAHRRLEHLTHLKDRFIQSIAHELRTPLTGVVGFANLLQSELATDHSPGVREYVDFLASAAEEGGGILENLLLAAELDDPGGGLPRTLSLGRTGVDLVTETHRVISDLPPSERHRVAVEASPASVFADQARVRQIIRNLLSNAIRHGGESIKLQTRNSGTSGRVIISDNGDGISVSQVEQAFSRYETRDRDPGLPEPLGLGLSVSRALARQMGGDITYKRAASLSIFTLELPAYRVSSR